jgi:hypothetical protein
MHIEFILHQVFCRTSLHRNVFSSNVFRRSNGRRRTTRSVRRGPDIGDNVVRHHYVGPPHQYPPSANGFVHNLVALSLQNSVVILWSFDSQSTASSSCATSFFEARRSLMVESLVDNSYPSRWTSSWDTCSSWRWWSRSDIVKRWLLSKIVKELLASRYNWKEMCPWAIYIIFWWLSVQHIVSELIMCQTSNKCKSYNKVCF